MALITRHLTSLIRTVGNNITRNLHQGYQSPFTRCVPRLPNLTSHLLNLRVAFSDFALPLSKIHANELKKLHKMHEKGPPKPKRKKANPFGENKPFAKGVVIRTVIRKPKKPNSANRKCVIVKLSTGKEMTAYVPGEGHNLQEHNVVLCRVGRVRDVPGIKIKCVRGKYDLGHVIKKQQ